MKRPLLSVALFFTGFLSFAQIAPSKYFVEFTDKNGTPYSVDVPGEFLSERAIERRKNQFIRVTEQDLPVNPSYVNQVAATGVSILNRTKWFNGLIIHTDDSTRLDVIESLPFVKKIMKNVSVGRREGSPIDKFTREENLFGISSPSRPSHFGTYNYGPTYWQIHMMNGDQLHDQGFRGEGKVIAVLDAGFLQVDLLKAFDSLRLNNQILGTRDFVNPGGNVYQAHIHGMCVLSVMGGNIPGTIIGTAPKASYWLLRSEDGDSEYIIEEYNWVCAAEFADSAGADIITSSLGYTTFYDTVTSHTCDEMDGNTAPATRGANIASLKGMAVLSSAGNEGDNANWQCMSAPADGDNVLAIGAVDSTGAYAFFSSKGVVDGTRVKPNVSAMGRKTWVYWTSNNLVQSSGTSFSCPLVAGMVACLWQAKPEITPARLYSSIQESSSHYSDPDSLTGYGIPDFIKAMNILTIPERETSREMVFPNPFTNSISIPVGEPHSDILAVEIANVTGQVVYREQDPEPSPDRWTITVTGLRKLTPGYYLVRIIDGSSARTFVAVKSAE